MKKLIEDLKIQVHMRQANIENELACIDCLDNTSQLSCDYAYKTYIDYPTKEMAKLLKDGSRSEFIKVVTNMNREKITIEEKAIKDLSRMISQIKWGLHYGYPECCIMAFVNCKDKFYGRDELKNDPAYVKYMGKHGYKQLRSNGNGYANEAHWGFIPCKKCREKVVIEGLHLKDLIKGRKDEFGLRK